MHAKRGGSQKCPNCGACKESIEHVLFESVSYDFQRQNFLDYMKQILALKAFTMNVQSVLSNSPPVGNGSQGGLLGRMEY